MYACTIFMIFYAFFGPLVSSICTSSTLWSVLAPALQVLVPAHTQAWLSYLHEAHHRLLHKLPFRLLVFVLLFEELFTGSAKKSPSKVPTGNNIVQLQSLKLSISFTCPWELSLRWKHFNIQKVNYSKCCVWENYMILFKIGLRLTCVMLFLDNIGASWRDSHWHSRYTVCLPLPTGANRAI